MIILGLLMSIYYLFNLVTKPLVGIIPEMPAAVRDGAEWLIPKIVDVVGVVTTFLGKPLFTAVVVVLTATFLFDRLWAVIRWVYAKIPTSSK